MPFNEKSTPRNILKTQQDTESIVVSNIRVARNKAIKEALKKAKKPQDVHKYVKVANAVNQGVFFAWQQGMYAGVRHAENELDKQVRKNISFSLSYGLNDIIEFSEPTPEELRERSKRSYNRRLRGAWTKRSKTKERLDNLTEQELLNEIQDPYDSAIQSLNIAQQREIYNTFNNRYTALSSSSDFAQTYLTQRRSTISTITEKAIQDEIKENIAEYIKSKPTERSQRKLMKELVSMYASKGSNDFKDMKNTLTQKQESLRDKVTRREIDDTLAQVDRDPEVSRLAGFIDDEEDILRQAKERGDSPEEIAEIENDLNDLRAQYNQARDNATPESFKRRATDKIRQQIGRQEKRLEDRQSDILSNRDNESRDLAKLEQQIVSDRQTYRDKLAEVNDMKDIAKNRRNALERGKISVEDLTRKERKIYDARQEKLIELDRLKVTLDQSNDAAKFKRGAIDEIDKDLSVIQKELNDGDFGVTLPSRGKKTTLTEDEKDELIRLLDLESDGAIGALDKEMSIADLERLKDRVTRKSNLFNDEKAVNNAKRLATTEVSAAYNIGRLQVFLTKGISYVQWISTIDDRTSEFCQSLHKKVFALDNILKHIMWVQRFPKTNEPEFSPFNKSISPRGVWVPPAHPNCRSYLQPVYLREDEDQLSKDVKNQELLQKLISAQKLEARGKDKSLVGYLKRQAELRDRQAKEYLRSLNLTSTLFKAGVSAIVSRFAEEGIAAYNEERVFENDADLVSVLLGGTVALGTASMMYFFLRGNLSSSLKQAARRTLSPNVPDSKNFLGTLTKKEAAEITEQVLVELENIKPATKGLYLQPSQEQIDDLLEMDVDNLLSNGKLGYALALEGVELEDIAGKLISEKQLEVDAGKAFINRLRKDVIKESRQKFSDLNRRALDIMTDSFGHLGVDIKDIDNIKEIQVWANGSANVVYKNKKASLISGKKLRSKLTSNKFRARVIETGNEAQRMRRALQELEKGLDPSDVLAKAKIKQEIAKLNQLVKLKRLPQLKMTPVVKDLAQEFDEVLNLDVVRQQDFIDIQEGYASVSQASKNVLDKFKANLPSSRILSINPESIDDVTRLKSILEAIDNSLERVQNTFLFKEGRKFKPGKIEDIVDIRSTLESLEMTAKKFEDTSINVNYQSTIDKINGVVSEQMSSDYGSLLKQKIDIQKRIKELE